MKLIVGLLVTALLALAALSAKGAPADETDTVDRWMAGPDRGRRVAVIPARV
jgi:hypothetical protein